MWSFAFGGVGVGKRGRKVGAENWRRSSELAGGWARMSRRWCHTMRLGASHDGVGVGSEPWWANFLMRACAHAYTITSFSLFSFTIHFLGRMN